MKKIMLKFLKKFSKWTNTYKNKSQIKLFQIFLISLQIMPENFYAFKCRGYCFLPFKILVEKIENLFELDLLSFLNFIMLLIVIVRYTAVYLGLPCASKSLLFIKQEEFNLTFCSWMSFESNRIDFKIRHAWVV